MFATRGPSRCRQAYVYSPRLIPLAWLTTAHFHQHPAIINTNHLRAVLGNNPYTRHWLAIHTVFWVRGAAGVHKYQIPKVI